MYRRLADASRAAGMAEVATEILHTRWEPTQLNPGLRQYP